MAESVVMAEAVETGGPGGAPPSPAPAYAAQLVLRGELNIRLPAGLTAATAMSEDNEGRIRQLASWQLQYLQGALRHEPSLQAQAPVALAGRRDLRLLEVRAGAAPQEALVQYELRDVLMSAMPVKAGEVSVRLPRAPAEVFAKASGATGGLSCSATKPVVEDHLWFFWDPAPSRCGLGDGDLVRASLTLEPLRAYGPQSPDYVGLLGDGKGLSAAGSLKVIYMIGDDQASGESAGGASVARGADLFAQAAELLGDAGYDERAGRDRGARRRISIFGKKVGGVTVTVELQLVDPTSFEFAKASATALETADVFVYNGQTGLGNCLNWERYERILGRPLSLPRKPQVFVFNGASPFAFESARLYALKATAADPEGFAALDVVTTTPAVPSPEDGLVDLDITLIDGLLASARPTWQALLEKGVARRKELGVLTYVTGDH